MGSIYSCNESVSDPGESASKDFLFRVIIINSNGQPVPGLRVSAYNDPSKGGFSNIQQFYRGNKITSQSTLNFAISNNCKVTLSLYELNGNILQQPLNNELLDMGMYAVTLSVNNTMAGTRVYKAVLRAVNDTTNIQFFTDSIFITLWQPDPMFSILGYTSNEGIFEMYDTLSFPNLLTLPPMVRTFATGPDSVGIFTFSNDIVITLSDTINGMSQTYIRSITKGKNEFELNWNPSGYFMSSQSNPIQRFEISKIDTGNTVITPDETRLYQNYPNPFN
jgi:hypothetical protein